MRKIIKNKKRNGYLKGREKNLRSIVRGYENQLSVAKGCRADYIITYGNY